MRRGLRPASCWSVLMWPARVHLPFLRPYSTESYTSLTTGVAGEQTSATPMVSKLPIVIKTLKTTACANFPFRIFLSTFPIPFLSLTVGLGFWLPPIVLNRAHESTNSPARLQIARVGVQFAQWYKLLVQLSKIRSGKVHRTSAVSTLHPTLLNEAVF